MLIDDYVESLQKQQKYFAANVSAHAPEAIEFLGNTSQHFVLSPLTVETCIALADPNKIENARDYLYAPAIKTWIEWSGDTPGFSALTNRHGLLLDGRVGDDGSIVLGSTRYVFDTHINGEKMPMALHFVHDLQADDIDILSLAPFAGQAQNDPWRTILASIDVKLMGAFLGATLALIGTPRVSKTIPHENIKLNMARQKRNQPPLLRYEQVVLAIDDHIDSNGNRLPTTGEKALHHVRSHLRLKRGQVELVRPHWRGNPSFGVVMKRHLVTRDEDVFDGWQGAHMPASRVIDELDEN